MKKTAVRNLRLCTKDCLCLYVCPTGATDTENSIIDTDKCTGCGDCAAACQSGAISMVVTHYPPQQQKNDDVKSILTSLAENRCRSERIARQLARKTDRPGEKKLLTAIAISSRLVAEDIMREAGFMLPQSRCTQELREKILSDPPQGFPAEAAQKLLEMIESND